MIDVLTDLQAAADARVGPATWKYIQSMAGANVQEDEHWASIDLVPRMFRDVGHVSTEASFGQHVVSTPVMVSPTGAHGLCHPGRELETADGAAAAGALFCYSSSRRSK